MFDEQEFDRLRQKRNCQRMSDDVKWESRAEIRHLHYLRVVLRPEGLIKSGGCAISNGKKAVIGSRLLHNALGVDVSGVD